MRAKHEFSLFPVKTHGNKTIPVVIGDFPDVIKASLAVEISVQISEEDNYFNTCFLKVNQFVN